MSLENKKPSLKVVSLNVGRSLRNPFPEAFLADPKWDVLCIQDMRESHMEKLTELFPGAQCFAPMCRHEFCGVREGVGIGIFSRRYPFLSTSVHAYVNNVSPVLDLKGTENDAHDIVQIRATESRLAVFCEMEVDGELFSIGTTHGTWVARGIPDEHQLRTMKKLAVIAGWKGNSVMAGDFNFARDGEVYKAVMEENAFTDCLPRTITNTLDPEFHSIKGKFDVVSDYFFRVGGRYDVSDVQVTFGVSDHGALSGKVSLAE